MKKITLTILLFLFLFINSFPQTAQKHSIEDGWQGIIPVKSNRIEVEKEFGSLKEIKRYYSVYETDDVVIEITYSGKPCTEKIFGEWAVPQDTVLFYTVKPKKELLVSSLNLDKNKFQRIGSRNQIDSSFEYYSFEKGISLIGVSGQNSQEAITVIAYYFGKNYDRLKCK